VNVSLTPELEKLIDEKVKSGLYHTASEVVREGLRLLKQRDDHARLRADVRAGFDEIEKGQYFEYDENTAKDLAEDIKSRGRARLAQAKPKQRA